MDVGGDPSRGCHGLRPGPRVGRRRAPTPRRAVDSRSAPTPRRAAGGSGCGRVDCRPEGRDLVYGRSGVARHPLPLSGLEIRRQDRPGELSRSPERKVFEARAGGGVSRAPLRLRRRSGGVRRSGSPREQRPAHDILRHGPRLGQRSLDHVPDTPAPLRGTLAGRRPDLDVVCPRPAPPGERRWNARIRPEKGGRCRRGGASSGSQTVRRSHPPLGACRCRGVDPRLSDRAGRRCGYARVPDGNRVCARRLSRPGQGAGGSSSGRGVYRVEAGGRPAGRADQRRARSSRPGRGESPDQAPGGSRRRLGRAAVADGSRGTGRTPATPPFPRSPRSPRRRFSGAPAASATSTPPCRPRPAGFRLPRPTRPGVPP